MNRRIALIAVMMCVASATLLSQPAGALSALPSGYTITQSGSSGWVITLATAPPNEHTYFGVNFTSTTNDCNSGTFAWLDSTQPTVYSAACSSGGPLTHYQWQYYDGSWHNLTGLIPLAVGDYTQDGTLIVVTPPETPHALTTAEADALGAKYIEPLYRVIGGAIAVAVLYGAYAFALKPWIRRFR